MSKPKLNPKIALTLNAILNVVDQVIDGRVKDPNLADFLDEIFAPVKGSIMDLSDENPDDLAQIRARWSTFGASQEILVITQHMVLDALDKHVQNEQWKRTLQFVLPEALALIQILLDKDPDNKAQILEKAGNFLTGDNFENMARSWLSLLIENPVNLEIAISLINVIIGTLIPKAKLSPALPPSKTKRSKAAKFTRVAAKNA